MELFYACGARGLTASLLRLQIPNQKLMEDAVINVTQSRAFQDRVYFEVDARRVTAAMIEDLSDRVHTLVHADAGADLFDRTFDSFAYVHAVHNPLKYEVRVTAHAPALGSAPHADRSGALSARPRFPSGLAARASAQRSADRRLLSAGVQHGVLPSFVPGPQPRLLRHRPVASRA